MENVGKMLVVAGLGLAALGVFIWLIGPRLSSQGGVLPGDIHVQRGNVSFYFPIVTCLVISLLLSLLFRLFNR